MTESGFVSIQNLISMVKVKPFAAIRPPKDVCKQVSCRPYDVMSSEEAKLEAGEMSLLHITKPEIDFDPIAVENEKRVYDRAVSNFKEWKEKGLLRPDSRECYYLYALTMGSRTQFGIVLCVHIDDYFEGFIKKHELTRKDKEDDRMVHVLIQNANVEPVFLAYRDDAVLDGMISKYSKNNPEYDFTADEDGTHHTLWVIDDAGDIRRITEAFAEIPALYVADGHHRTAAAARVGKEKRESNPHHDGSEEYNYFLAVCFPESHLRIMEYNRLLKDLGGMECRDFLRALENDFVVTDKGMSECKPSCLHEFSLYMAGNWYSLRVREDSYDDSDPVGRLDVNISSELILKKILGIGNLRTTERVEFVGGIRGMEYLKDRVDSGDMVAALILYPVTMRQITAIADAGGVMPPKATWFEPKLRSGLFIHSLVNEQSR